jgi:hypothetical protein
MVPLPILQDGEDARALDFSRAAEKDGAKSNPE